MITSNCWNRVIGAKSFKPEMIQKVSIGYTLSAAKAFSTLPNSKKPFRFVFTSGFLTTPDPKQSAWIMGAGRKAGGEAETAILDFGKDNEGF
jgi:hypothetical protein